MNLAASAFCPAPAPQVRTQEIFETPAKLEKKKNRLAKFATKYKTELCKNWIEVGFCRYEEQCKFAHGAHEMVVPQQENTKRDKNCKTFFKTKQCPYGVRCQFNHEHRDIDQIKRYAYTAKLYTYESLYANSMDQAIFVNTFESDVPKLPVFQSIHAEGLKQFDAIGKQALSESDEFPAEEAGSTDSTNGSLNESAMDISQFYLSD